MIRFHFTYNKEKAAAWLNKMDREGLDLKKAFGPFYSFGPSKPGKYVYQVDYAPWPADTNANYRQTMEELGVDVVSRFGPWVYLRKEADGSPFDLYTDRESRVGHLKRVAHFFKVMAIVEFICVVMLVFAADQLSASWPWIFVAVGLAAAVGMSVRTTQINEEIVSLQTFGAVAGSRVSLLPRVFIGIGGLLVLMKYLLENAAPLVSNFLLGAGFGLMALGLIYLSISRHPDS